MVKNSIKNVNTRNIAGKIAALSMAAMIAVGGLFSMRQSSGDIPELTVFIDHQNDSVVIDDGSVPLSGEPKVEVKKKKKVVKLKKAAKKTYKKKSTKKKTSTKKQSNGTVAEVVVETVKTQKFKKGSKKKVVITKITTTTTLVASTNSVQSAEEKKGARTVSLSTLAPKLNSNLMNAFNDLGFSLTVDPSVSYSGYFNSRTRSITLKTESDVVYHEMGHFLAFIAGNADIKDDFKSIYDAEKHSYVGSNKAYVIQNSSEYFAESFRDYTLNPAGLKQSRPRTFSAIENALNQVTESQVGAVRRAYSPIWG